MTRLMMIWMRLRIIWMIEVKVFSIHQQIYTAPL
jgi:hypothetical protein